MECLTLNGNLQPDRLVENYKSLIFTERFGPCGDFELVSENVYEAVNLLPRGSFLSLRESTVPMIVEDHFHEVPLTGPPSVKIVGRSLDSCLELRASVKDPLPLATARPNWQVRSAKETDAAFLMLRTVLGDSDQYISGRHMMTPRNPAVSPRDAIPEIGLTIHPDYTIERWDSGVGYFPGDTVGTFSGNVYSSLSSNFNVDPDSDGGSNWQLLSTGWGSGSFQYLTTPTIEIKPGNLYAVAKEMLDTNFASFKAVRPDTTSTQAKIEIYKGMDKRNSVVFDARYDQFLKAQYVLSNRGSTNIGYIYGSNGAQQVDKVTYADPGDEPSGLDRRVLFLDLTNQSGGSDEVSRKSLGLIELYKYNATALFDGEIAQQVAQGYNTDYNLGDVIRLTGEFGLTADVQVKEFIRSYDSSGYKAYPTFEAVNID